MEIRLRQELNIFLKNYVQATKTHDFDKLEPFISPDAVYWSELGSHQGLVQIRHAFYKSWSIIQNEQFYISQLEWINANKTEAVCTYQFTFSAIMKGKKVSGQGNATNVCRNQSGEWKMIHEHLHFNP